MQQSFVRIRCGRSGLPLSSPPLSPRDSSTLCVPLFAVLPVAAPVQAGKLFLLELRACVSLGGAPPAAAAAVERFAAAVPRQPAGLGPPVAL